MGDGGRIHTMTLSSDPIRLREARRWVSRLTLEAGLEPAQGHDLSVAFSEVCANVHRHAYRGRRDGRVEIRVQIEDDRIVLTLDHQGERFDPREYRPPDLARPAESGYGMYLIERLVDDVSFEDRGLGGRVVLVKRRRPAVVRS